MSDTYIDIMDADVEYDLAMINDGFKNNYSKLNNIALSLEKVMEDNLSIEAFNISHNTSVEGGKFDLLVSYLERVYTTIMNLVSKIVKFIKRTWMRLSMAPKNDKLAKELLIELKGLEGKTVSASVDIEKLVFKNSAYFTLLEEEEMGTSDFKGLLKTSVKARKGMLDGEPVELDSGTTLKESYLKGNFKSNIDFGVYENEYIFLSTKGKYVYILGKVAGSVKFGTGYKVLSLEINKGNAVTVVKLTKGALSVKSCIERLDSMMNIDQLYRVVTGGIYEEIEAIEHDLEADRLRKLKEMRSKSSDGIDDLRVHNQNVQMHSKIVRTMAGLTKAFMYIGNGLVYDRDMRIKSALAVVKELKG